MAQLDSHTMEGLAKLLGSKEAAEVASLINSVQDTPPKDHSMLNHLPPILARAEKEHKQIIDNFVSR